MTRAHHSAIDDDVAFIMIILVAGTVWAHKAFMTKAIHYLLVAWLIGLVVFLVLVVYKVIGKVSQWRYKQGASLAEIDNTTGQDFES